MGSVSNLVKNASFGLLDIENEAGATAAGNAAAAREHQLKKAVEFGKEGLSYAQQGEKDINAQIMQAIQMANSPQELRALTQSIESQQQNVARQTELFNSIDPTILAASEQALKLIQGEEARSLGPLRDERKRQRQALLDSLREQLGPGAETSTAGIQALTAFDQETSSLMNNAQQASLGQLFGIAQQGAQGRGALNQSNATTAQIGQGFGNMAGRISSTAMQGTNVSLGALGNTRGAFADLMNAQSGLAAGAGSQFVADQLKANSSNQFINDRIQAGEQIGASAVGGASGGASGGGCCFIFLEARYGNGTMDFVVRRYRDEQMTPRNKRGYYKVAQVLVPLMRKSRIVKWLTRTLMTDPLVAYGKYHYGENKWGWIFKPLKSFWLGLFDFLGQEHEFLRENGEVV